MAPVGMIVIWKLDRRIASYYTFFTYGFRISKVKVKKKSDYFFSRTLGNQVIK